MVSVKLADGRELCFDLMRISMREYRELFTTDQPAEDGDALVGRCCGMTAEELAALPQPEYRRVMQAFFRAAREPLADADSPNP